MYTDIQSIDAPTDAALFDELLCIADTKLVLAGWYMLVLPNGRGIPDWNALSGMMQDHYGHSRALYQYLSRFGLTREQAEWARPPEEIRSAAILNRPPGSWADFVVTMFLTEHLLSVQLSGYRANTQDRGLAGLAAKMERETRFHKDYALGWLQALADEDAALVQGPLDQHFGEALDWWGADDDLDPLSDAGLRVMSNAALRSRFIESVSAEMRGIATVPSVGSPPQTWQRQIRRFGAPGIPTSLHELIRFKYVEFAVP
jgi:1,2-phenylacetyl-CoA epoxidase catalytic subunit